MNKLKFNFKQFLISLDQALCCLIGLILTLASFIFIFIPKQKYYADESLSSRSYRLYRDGKLKWPCILIDTILFWDREGEKKHCELSYISEIERNQCPPEFRI